MGTYPDFYHDSTLDLWAMTMAAFPWKNKLFVFQKYNDYPVLNKWFARDRTQFQGGTRIEWQAMIDDSGNGRMINAMEPQTYNIQDYMGKFHAEWKLWSGYYAVVDDEIEGNQGEAVRLQNLLKTRRVWCQMGAANQLEELAWKVPTGTAEEQAKQPHGVPYSVVPITGAQVTAGTWGFAGQNAVGFTECYGVDSATEKYERYRNYVDVWTNADAVITEEDILKITQMLRFLRFRGPTNAEEFKQWAGLISFYTNNTMLKALERKARENNDNLGADLGKFSGQVVTQGITYNWVPVLDTWTTNPLVALDHECFFPFVHKNEYFRETGPTRLPNQHRVVKTDVDLKYDFCNINRKRTGRIDWVVAA